MNACCEGDQQHCVGDCGECTMTHYSNVRICVDNHPPHLLVQFPMPTVIQWEHAQSSVNRAWPVSPHRTREKLPQIVYNWHNGTLNSQTFFLLRMPGLFPEIEALPEVPMFKCESKMLTTDFPALSSPGCQIWRWNCVAWMRNAGRRNAGAGGVTCGQKLMHVRREEDRKWKTNRNIKTSIHSYKLDSADKMSTNTLVLVQHWPHTDFGENDISDWIRKVHLPHRISVSDVWNFIILALVMRWKL